MTPVRITVTCAAAMLLAAVVFAGAPAAAAGSSAADASALSAPENERCFRCHGSSETNVTVPVDGVQKSIKVDQSLYDASSHGELACTSCHLGFKPGPHTPEQTNGWLETAEIEACRNCHADVFSMYRGSFHGDLVFDEASGKAPVCADCHEAHNILPPESQEFRAGIDALCARCHAEEQQTYLNSYHGKAFHLGDAETAVCIDCHGGHRILAPSDPKSSVNEANLVETCSRCHPGANENFAGFMVHVDPKDPTSSVLVWSFYAAYILLIVVVFSFGFTHSALYIYRGIKDGLYRRRSHDS